MLKLKEAMSEGWWDNLSKDAQAAYKKAHPGSQQAKNSKDTDDSQRDSIKTGIKKAIAKDKKGQDKRKKLNRKWDDAQKQKGMDKASDLAKKGMEKGRVPDEDDYDMGEVPGSREEWEDIEPGDPEMRSGDESAEELGDLMKQQQNHIEDMFEKGADREDIEAAEGNLEDLEREYNEKVESGEGEDDEDDWGKKPDGDVDPDKFFKDRDKAKGLVKGKRQGRTGNELNQETLTIDGKQFRRMSEGVEQKPKYEFSEFYKRFKR